jgi:hypothetical protein
MSLKPRALAARGSLALLRPVPQSRSVQSLPRTRNTKCIRVREARGPLAANEPSNVGWWASATDGRNALYNGWLDRRPPIDAQMNRNSIQFRQEE